jgi:hypothetical protein
MATPLEPLQFDKSVDSVELKLTVPDGEIRSTFRAMKLDLLNTELRQVYFFDTPELDLFHKGIVLRARRIQNANHDCVVKLRPVVPGNIAARWRNNPDLTIEVDVVAGKAICSASLKTLRRPARIEDVLDGQLPLRQLFRKEQREFLDEHAPADIPWDRLVPLGPINVAKLKNNPKGFPFPVTAEIWLYPDGSAMLELSAKVKPHKVEKTRAQGRQYLESINLRPEQGNQETKTKKALLFFSKRIPKHAAKKAAK